MRKRTLKVIGIFFIIVVALLIFAGRSTDTIWGRIIRWGPAKVNHYKVFPIHKLTAAPSFFSFPKNDSEEMIRSIFSDIEYTKNQKVGDLDQFLERTKTQAFIVIHRDKVLFEKYYNGCSRDSIVTSFSVAKSFTSALIGLAIDEGYIHSVNDPITDYLPELKVRDSRFSDVKISDLLHMSSGFGFREPPDDIISYYDPNLRKAALERARIEEEPGKHYLYNKYHPQLLGIILERATKRPVTQYLQEKIWNPLGMEFDGSWSIDSTEHQFEKMECGINDRAIDFAKFGRLYVRQGNWDGKQLISSNWIQTSALPYIPQDKDYYPNWPFFHDSSGYYAFMWWGIKRNNESND
ncbi:MAG: serine hydrolase, partial [Candidatus Atribacteria bacterium]|nr:serine hydrolase [Candidatus Atribacteria bacterium]